MEATIEVLSTAGMTVRKTGSERGYRGEIVEMARTSRYITVLPDIH